MVRRHHESQFREMKMVKTLVFSNSEEREENVLLKPHKKEKNISLEKDCKA